ncbi:winged helix-turn-helix transcriptional regulator [Psittacicella gerlachiana]|uniref:HTH hxlR-type domain-containing protein n=1 Tax=Psittacicella gerlachiana TaxID=2028574 RepID=A0A3A1YJP9_9GAMM|nr:helix-turn-helix domain-containing protein [Psittacicella gerlachiana]RIY36464.1 hypothetical protein CKF59_02630 [Psittacicella gerlachiana]
MDKNKFDTIETAAKIIGDSWNLLIIRQIFLGNNRFEDIRKALQIAPTMLTKRLNNLVATNILQKELYSQRPARYAYTITPVGRDLGEILILMRQWGIKHLGGVCEDQLIDVDTGKEVKCKLIDEVSGKDLASLNLQMLSTSKEDS